MKIIVKNEKDFKIIPNQDNKLPKLDKISLEKINSTDKDIVLKRNIIERNNKQHLDLTKDDEKNVLSALYKYDLIFQDKNKPNYFHFVQKNNNINYIVLLDATKDKINLEIVHYHKINDKNLEKLINKNK